MNKIPAIAYFYWGAESLPFVRYMAIYSFAKYNPEFQVVLFTPTKLTTNITWGTHENEEPLDARDYMNELKGIVNVSVRAISMESIGFSNDIPEVVKSDLLRLYLLSTTGGYWSDNDIIYVKPIPQEILDGNHKAIFCYRRGGPTQEDTKKNGPKYHSIGYLAAEPESLYFKKLFEGARRVMNTGEYQSVGSPYYGETINMNDPDILNLDINFVYPSRAAHNLFTDPAGCHLYQVLPHTIGFHFYGGAPNSGKFQNILTHENYMNYDNVICSLIGKVLNDG